MKGTIGCFSKPTPTQEQLGFYIPWIKNLVDGQTNYKDLVDKVIIEVQKWLTDKADVYTVDRSSFHTIVFIYDICKHDKDLKEWILTFDPKTATNDEYLLFHGTLHTFSLL